MNLERNITLDLPCTSCQYNLRGLPAEQRCPECGQDIAETIRAVSAGETFRHEGTLYRIHLDWLNAAAEVSGSSRQAARFNYETLGYLFQRSGWYSARRAEIPEWTAREFCRAVRDYAVFRSGDVQRARMVLGRLGIERSEDIGKLVGLLVIAGLVPSSASESQEDFANLCTLDTLFSPEF